MNDTVKHTPGPWFETKFFDIMDSDGTFIGVAFRETPDERAANARLIAAAPDLLDALVMVRDADNDCHSDGLDTIPPMARAKIDAAIARAEGRS